MSYDPLLAKADQLLTQQQWDAAIPCYEDFIKTHPEHFEATFNLASCYLEKEDRHTAYSLYQKATHLNEDDPDTFYNLGTLALHYHRYTEARQHFQVALALNPDSEDGLINLAYALLKLEEISDAIEVLQKIPEHSEHFHYAQYKLAALTNTAPNPTHQQAYIKEVFNDYAETYEQDMQDDLRYCLPLTVAHHVQKLFPNRMLNILELGCGTGLAGLALKPYANTLVGIDIAETMLEQAQDKNCYTELVCEDLLTWLSKETQSFELIVAVDTLIYFGCLEAILTQCFERLTPSGCLVFSLERGKQKPFVNTASGRFQHHPSTLKRLAKRFNARFHRQKTIGRYERGQPVKMDLYTFRKVSR